MKIKVQNFRMLKDCTVDIEDNLSLIIGKNNCGKTSLLLALDKFLNNSGTKHVFTFDDFNNEFKQDLKKHIAGEGDVPPLLGISLKVFIEYDDDDDLANIGNKVIMD